MDDHGLTPGLERNPVTHARHRREVLWQITAPLAVGVVILLALAVLTTLATADQASVWADISLMWLIMPALIAAFIFMIILAGSVYITMWLIRELPLYFQQTHLWLLLFGEQVRRIGDKMVEPILRIQSFSSSIRTLDQQVRRK